MPVDISDLTLDLLARLGVIVPKTMVRRVELTPTMAIVETYTPDEHGKKHIIHGAVQTTTQHIEIRT